MTENQTRIMPWHTAAVLYNVLVRTTVHIYGILYSSNRDTMIHSSTGICETTHILYHKYSTTGIVQFTICIVYHGIASAGPAAGDTAAETEEYNFVPVPVSYFFLPLLLHGAAVQCTAAVNKILYRCVLHSQLCMNEYAAHRGLYCTCTTIVPWYSMVCIYRCEK